MSVAKMAKVNIICRKKDRGRVVERLQDLGSVQIVDHAEDDFTLCKVDIQSDQSEVEYIHAGIKFALDYLTPFEKKIGSFLDRVVGGKPQIKQSEVVKRVNHVDFPAIIKKAQRLESEHNRIENEIVKQKEEKELLEPWSRVLFIPNRNNLPDGYTYYLFIGTNGLVDRISSSLQSHSSLFHIEKVNRDEKSEYGYIICEQVLSTAVTDILQREHAQIVDIDNLKMLISERLLQAEEQNQILRTKLDTITHHAEQLAVYLPQLRIGYDYYSWQQSSIHVLSNARETHDTTILVAWVPRDSLKTIEHQLKTIEFPVAVIEVAVQKDEEPPVLMQNNKLVAPFEAITTIYGAPQYKEPDPTAWLTPFFIIFFGLALTDVGYGIILAGLAALGLKFMAHTQEAKKLMKVLLVGGISTAILGALFGGWLGIAIDTLPVGGVRDTLLGLRLVDPVSNPIAVLLLSLALGVIQVIVGLVVNLQWQWRHNNKKEAFLGSGVWLVFLTVLLLWGLSKADVIPSTWNTILSPLALGATALVVLAGTRKTENWFLKLPIGILSLYDVVGYFSDVLSYSRLLALGLGTGIIAMVVNLVASLAQSMVPYVGWVLFVLILIGGHVFNIAVNVLGAYIHSSRLQFVEFFPKFMEGGGKVFTPFRKESKYIRLQN